MTRVASGQPHLGGDPDDLGERRRRLLVAISNIKARWWLRGSFYLVGCDFLAFELHGRH
jgi:hypothetical protein